LDFGLDWIGFDKIIGYWIRYGVSRVTSGGMMDE
jgi:hypothetical protein